MRGKDYGLLDLSQVQIRLAQPPDQHTTHPETGTCRALFDCPGLLLTPIGQRTRVIVATHPGTETKAPVGTTRGEVVYEFFSLPCRWMRLLPLMSLPCTCIAGHLRRCWQMKTRNRIWIVGGK
ncbi:hypothetical protein [Ktedonobacter racemifer]|uniref:Uncharacterized protein n=1 Tax=Ktedonobacter racemifer DSM 44963 TaxID=485913 RepID=D6TDH8_KTERA|nr:hypothetical protein [Ktedonobacter racemifer]EFH88323.1 hypothetical protein Krac_9756 [Ktedonobacter racemifer DSM 44963]